MRFKVNNRYVVDAKSHDDAIRVVKMLDAMETYSIRWIDTYAKSQGYGPDFWRYDAEIKADNVKEALEKLAKKVALAGTGTANCLVMHVSNSHATYQFSGRLSELLKKTKEQLGDSVKDAEHATKLVKAAACKDARRINYDDDIIEVTLNGKVVFKGYAEEWLDDNFDSNFKWTGSQYEASNAKGKWVVKVVDSVKDGKYVSELKPGDVITKKDGSKWDVVFVRHTPFGIQVRINSKTSPVKTEEITYRPTDMLAYDSVKDADEYMIEGNIVDKDDPMMTYRAYQNIARKYHLTIKNYTGDMLDLYGSKNDLQRYERDMHMSFSAIEKAHDSVKDAESDSDVDLDFLIKDEIEAIDGYRKMIAKTTNPQLLSVLSHILDEETEHVEELRAAQAGVYEVEDD